MEQQKVEVIRQMYKEGKKTTEIAKILDISASTVCYWLDENYRKSRIKAVTDNFKNKSLADRQIVYNKRKVYINNYIKKRYATDEAFRNKVKERASKNYKLKKEVNNEKI